MTIKTIPYTDATTLFGKLEDLALSGGQYAFRGHQNSNWLIESTLTRYTNIPMNSFQADLEEMLIYFMYKMKSLDSIPFDNFDRRSILEFGRHYGVPTPVIDFSWSPYVATYFAFSSIQWRYAAPVNTETNEAQNAAIIALDTQLLAQGWVKSFQLRPEEYDNFLYESPDFFATEYPADVLKFIHFPASWNRRMQSQQGCFVYDALTNASGAQFRSFHDFVEKIQEPSQPGGGKKPTAYKFLVPHSEAGRVFAKLELMNINGINLIDREGVASDIKNTYNYNRKSGYTWDLLISGK
ncbi:hypothetical protein OICFNHDK_3296 [Methylobacterium bullatum]|uniref:FRG domain-containing protein n=2 Tax=Methylobacterium bullatum TaxID=570505 RepID=A0AAV4ZA14_9HYPH|nr:hypothetical protein OICFNHDK_3296 [Methylobacterium bullatum]